MKRVGSNILKEWKIQSYIQPWQLLALIAEHYSHCCLILQRDVLALHCGEAKAHYNTLKDFSKILLSEAWLTKNLYNELWGTIYSKGWGDPWHSPLWQFKYPHDSSPTLWLLHPTIDIWLTLDMTQHYKAHVLMWDNMAWASLARHHWHSVRCDETNSFDMFVMVKVVSWWQAWSSVMVCMHLMVTSCWSELLHSLQPVHWFGSFIQLVC